MAEFEAWPKIPRWNREIVITEKIDGTNAAIIIEDITDNMTDNEVSGWGPTWDGTRLAIVEIEEVDRPDHFRFFGVHAQSRTRLVTPEQDNFGFATYVKENAEGLVKLLGPGRHFGEWYGKGIQRNYGLDHKRFALFDVHRWNEFKGWGRVADGQEHTLDAGLCVDVVPALSRLSFPLTWDICEALDSLAYHGSVLVPGFMKPEGVVIYHTAGRQTYKVLLEGDDTPKGVAA